jgi:SmpA / OmlA family
MRRGVLVVSISLTVAIISAIVVYAVPHGVPPNKLTGVQEGMSRDDVVRLLGPPVSASRFSDVRSKISYSKPFQYCEVDVFLDPADHVTGVRHDH